MSWYWPLNGKCKDDAVVHGEHYDHMPPIPHVTKEEVQEQVDKLEEEFRQKLCPLNNMRRCDQGCVGFVHGYPATYRTLDGIASRTYAVGPACSLFGTPHMHTYVRQAGDGNE